MVLFTLNMLLYVLMWGLYLARLMLFRKRFLDDLFDHQAASAVALMWSSTPNSSSTWADVNSASGPCGA